MTVTVKRSVCPYDCPDACGLLVDVDGERAVRVYGDPEHPHTRGTLCAKMNRYQDTAHSPRRLTTPLLRTGVKGAGEFRPIGWDEAVERITQRWRAIIAESGAEAVLPYSYAGTMGLIQRNAGHPFFYRLGASQLDRTICTPAKAVGWEAVMGGTPAPHPDAVADSDLVILWGINAVATNIHFLHGVRQARKRGAQVWLIDTYRTETAALADRTFLVRPGHDGALALGLMHLLVREKLVDRHFLETSVQGFAELESQVLPDYPPERVSELTGLAGSALLEMACAYGRARAPFIRIGGGLSRYGNGAMTVRSIVALPALVGAWGKPGGGCLCGTSTGGAFAMHEVLREDFMTTPTRLVNMNQLGDALTELTDPPVRSLYVYTSNPAAVAPDQNRVLRGLLRDDLFTVVHERFLTDTARYADLVLPATTSLEHSDLYRSYGTYCIQRAQPVIPPVGLSKSNWEVFSLLAEAMGFREPFFRQSADDLIDRLLAIPKPMREGIDLVALAQGRAVELQMPRGASVFATPSGKIELLNPAQPRPLPVFIPPYGGDLSLSLMTAPALYTLNSSFYERDDLRRRQPVMSLKMNLEDAAARGLADGAQVIAANEHGEVSFILKVSEQVPPGVVVAEGVWWLEFAPGKRSVNALTSQRLTDQGAGSTFYDNRVEVRMAR
jgi:anaerobic selenocysteine-containing dehydrogenase